MLPGTSHDIDDHYEINSILYVYICQVNGSIYMWWDTIFVLQLLHVMLMANLVCNRIQQTEQLLVADEPSPTSVVSASLKSVIELQIEYSTFVKMFQNLYHYPLAIIFAVALQSIGSKILLTINMNVSLLCLTS